MARKSIPSPAATAPEGGVPPLPAKAPRKRGPTLADYKAANAMLEDTVSSLRDQIEAMQTKIDKKDADVGVAAKALDTAIQRKAEAETSKAVAELAAKGFQEANVALQKELETARTLAAEQAKVIEELKAKLAEKPEILSDVFQLADALSIQRNATGFVSMTVAKLPNGQYVVAYPIAYYKANKVTCAQNMRNLCGRATQRGWAVAELGAAEYDTLHQGHIRVNGHVVFTPRSA